MSLHQDTSMQTPRTGLVEQDLGPLAWVQEELRKSLESAIRLTRRFVLEAQESGDSDLAALDTSPLRMAKQQLHQSSGALDMVDQPQVGLVLRAMEAAVQHYIRQPQDFTLAAVQTLEKTSFALLEYLDVVLAGKAVLPVALFTQYRNVQALSGQDAKVHPADLWPAERRLREPQWPAKVAPVAYGPEARSVLDTAVLQIVKSADKPAALRLRQLSLGLAEGQSTPGWRTFWKIAAGFFDAFAHGLLKDDNYTKRVASRVLMVYASAAKNQEAGIDRLLQDMLFFCSQAGDPAAGKAPVLQAVRNAFGLQRHQSVDYEQTHFGRFDPAVLAQARKRLAAVTELWSALVGGDRQKIKPVADQFSLVTDSLLHLHPGSRPLEQTLTQLTQRLEQTGQLPSTEIAMEVATAVLYLQAAFNSLDISEADMTAHTQILAQRLQRVMDGHPPAPLEAWMEQLYHQVSDQQTMGSVVGELRQTLSEAEKHLDQYFRTPEDIKVLQPVGSLLAQIRGVLSVLGLDPAAQAMGQMRRYVEGLQTGTIASEERQAVFDKLGNSLGVLGFLIDMLSYQPNMARKLYRYDEAAGELKLTMGRARQRQTDEAASAPAAPAAPVLAVRAEQAISTLVPNVQVEPAAAPHPAPSPAETTAPAASAPAPAPTPTPVPELTPVPAPELTPVPVPVPAPAPPAIALASQEDEDSDTELREIFLEEAEEVLANGQTALQTLARNAADLSEQTVLRRAFHTLKGSSRMVQLDEFGEAAWAMEQMLNAWLAEQKPMPAPMQALASQAMHGFAQWVQAIRNGHDAPWQATPFRASADAMRLHTQLVDLDLAAASGAAAPVPQREAIQPAQQAQADALELAPEAPAADPVPTLEPAPEPADSQTELSLELEPEPADSQTEPTLEPAPELPVIEPVPTALPTQQAIPTLDESFEFNFDLPAPESAEVAEVAEIAEPEAAAVPALPPQEDAAPAVEAAPVFSETLEAPPLAFSLPEEAPTKKIGDLQISLPLYNVYLTEAEEWSQKLSDSLRAWQANLAQPQPEGVFAWAHSLAGSSATVGFATLSQLARRLEHVLLHLQPLPNGERAQVPVLVAAADEIRRLLHQFAAGFLPKAQEAIEAQLSLLLDLPVLEEKLPEAVETTATTAAAPVLSEQIAQALQAQHELDAAMVQAMALDDDDDDDIDVLDMVDPDLFPIFEEEAQELLPTLNAALREWSAHPQQPQPRAALLRALHTLKGSARLAGAMRLGEMAHRLESTLEQFDTETVTSEDLEPLFTRLDAMDATFHLLRTVGEQQEEIIATAAAPAAAPATAAAPLLADTPAPAPTAPASAPALATAPLAAPTAVRAGPQSVVRVRTQLLDRLVNDAGEVMITRSRLDARVGQLRNLLGELSGNLERLRYQLRDMEVQAESQMQSRQQLTKDSGSDFDPLEFDRFTRVQELTRMLAESVNDVATVQRNLQREVTGAEDELLIQARLSRELQRDLLRTRMVEFDSIAERLYAVVRQAAKDTGKQVKLEVLGGTIEMDRGILERMTPAFEHLLRNCVAHGIEAPAQRQALGKPSAGNISIRMQQSGNEVSVRFSDDGAGLNLERIRAKAIENGLIDATTEVNAARAAQLIFMPGFSTAEQVSGISGRGVGMDVVRSEVLALGGRIETSTEPGQGSVFELVLPLTTAMTQVVMLRMGDFVVGVPASLVEVVRRLPLPELEAAYQSGTLVQADGSQLPFLWAGAVWSQSPRSTDSTGGKTRPVIIINSASQRLALHVDEVLGSQEVVVKNLGVQLARLPGLAGMSLLPSGAVVLIYNPVALVAVHGEKIRALGQGLPAILDDAQAKLLRQQSAAQDVQAGRPVVQAPLIMVVDDSITVRRVTQRLLQREGFRVSTAVDGLQALEKLQDELPDVILSDIEMPRMDGFDLLRNIRSSERLKDLPVIMITSRMATKHRDLAMALGANHYLGKPYGDEQLLGIIHSYTDA